MANRQSWFSLSILLSSAICPEVGLAQSVSTNTMICQLAGSEQRYVGTCSIPCSVNALAIDIDGPNAAKACTSPDRTVNAVLRPEGAKGHYLGTMEGKFPEDPTRFEFSQATEAKEGVAKTPFGWFKVTSGKVDATSVALEIDGNRTLPPNADDIRIIERTKALLADTATWDRNDTRECKPDQTSYSLFCALTKATIEVSGGVHYRQPALQVAREVLNEVGGGRLGKHRLMDYNNHKDTTLAEIHQLLDTSEQRLKARLR